MPLSTRLHALLGLAFIACTGATYAAFRELRHDDAFIFFQYARQLALGNGLVFNPGEKVLGVTSPLYTLLLAAVYPLAGQALPKVAVLFGAAAVSAQAVLVFLLLERRSRTVAAVMALLVGVGLTSSHTWMSLDTNLFAALVLATFWAQQRDRPALCGALLGLSFLCRYDAALLVPILFATAWAKKKALPRRLALVSFAVVVPWLAAATAYYGSFMPNTFFAKRALSPAGDYLGHYFWLLAHEPWHGLGGESRALAAVTVAAWLAGLAYLVRYLRPLLGLVGFSAAMLLAYAFIGAPAVQHWHMYLPGLTLALLGGLGTLGWLEVLLRGRRAAVIAAGLAVALCIGASELEHARTLEEQFWLGRRHRMYTEIAGWMEAHVAPGQVFLSSEIGTLGYLTGHRMIDPFGLINLTNDYPHDMSLASFMGVAKHYRPDVMLLDSVEVGRVVEGNSEYRMVKSFEWGSPWSTLLIRRPEVLVRPDELERLRAELPRAPK